MEEGGGRLSASISGHHTMLYAYVCMYIDR